MHLLKIPGSGGSADLPNAPLDPRLALDGSMRMIHVNEDKIDCD